MSVPLNFPDALASPREFISRNTRVQATPLLPEIELFLAHEMLPLWQLTENELERSGLPPPYWAFAWAGGQALARFILDNPQMVAGKHVLDLACGSGIVAIAAAQAGARSVLAADLDALACAACKMNAEHNNAQIQVLQTDLITSKAPPKIHRQTNDDYCAAATLSSIEVIVSGDVFYEQPMAEKFEAWLRAMAGAERLVLVGDPHRTYFPQHGVELLQRYQVITTRELEDSDLRNTAVWRIEAPS